ncbi:MAG: hypothetical protein LBU32_30100 [Clostridiales bacterium]|jgi:hypothetical protein|nr:hypothetical protein [Clostridiales bacterium]
MADSKERAENQAIPAVSDETVEKRRLRDNMYDMITISVRAMDRIIIVLIVLIAIILAIGIIESKQNDLIKDAGQLSKIATADGKLATRVDRDSVIEYL